MTEENVMEVSDNDIDLSAPCFGHKPTKGKNKGQLTKHWVYARAALKKDKGPSPNDGQKWVCRHLCKNDSMAPNGFVCINPQHLVWGTQKENMSDKTPEVRSKAGKEAAASPVHISKRSFKCHHCGKEGKGPTMQKYHFDRCPYRSLPDGT